MRAMAATTPRFADLVPHEVHEISGGPRVVAATTGAVPLVHVLLAFPAGAEDDPPGLEGLAALVPPMLAGGTARRSAGRIAEEAADLGLDLVMHAGWDSAVVAVEGLSEDLPVALDLLLDLVTSPAFDGETVERARDRQAAQLEGLEWRPDRAGDLWLARSLYGDTPYGRSVLGRAGSLAQIGAGDLADFHRRRYGLAGAVCVASGRFSIGDLLERLSSLPADARREAAALSDPPNLRERTVHSILVVDRPRAAQTEIRVGLPGPPRHDPDFPLVRLLVTVLDQRLRERLRRALGMTYRVRAHLEARRGPGPLVIEAAVAHERAGEAVREIHAELARLVDAPYAETEIRQARGSIVMGFLRSLQAAHQVAIKLKQAASLGAGHFDRQLASLDGAAAGTLADLARRRLGPPATTAIVAVGPARELAEALAGFGDVAIAPPPTTVAIGARR